jgi:hypothetical protein
VQHDMLQRGISNGDTVVGRGAAAKLIKDHERTRSSPEKRRIVSGDMTLFEAAELRTFSESLTSARAR